MTRSSQDFSSCKELAAFFEILWHGLGKNMETLWQDQDKSMQEYGKIMQQDFANSSPEL